jgi:hypothetical protein
MGFLLGNSFAVAINTIEVPETAQGPLCDPL